MKRLRVVHLITHFALGGATEVVLSTCRYADSGTFDTAVLCGETSQSEQSLLEHAQEMGLPVHVIPSLRRSIAPLGELRAYRDLVTWLRAHPCDVVHTSGSKAGIVGRLAAAKAGVPVIVHTVHGWGHHEHMRPAVRHLYVALERLAARHTDRIITVSAANRAKGLADGIGDPEQYRVIYNGIDIDRYRNAAVDRAALRHDLGIPEDAPVVGTVSRLAPQKAPADFLRVAELVRSRVPAAHFVFVGGGPLDAEFEHELRQRGLKDVVHLLGYRHDVPALLQVFDVFLLTSLWEGLPLVIQQAMCAGLPTVATAVDGTPEVVIEGETGFLAAPHDCAHMADRVTQLLLEPQLRLRLGQAGLQRVYPAFSDRAMVRGIEAVYRECAQSKDLLRGTAPPAQLQAA